MSATGYFLFFLLHSISKYFYRLYKLVCWVPLKSSGFFSFNTVVIHATIHRYKILYPSLLILAEYGIPLCHLSPLLILLIGHSTLKSFSTPCKSCSSAERWNLLSLSIRAEYILHCNLLCIHVCAYIHAYTYLRHFPTRRTLLLWWMMWVEKSM